MTSPSIPPCCSIRGCAGGFLEKLVGGERQIVCDVASHHRGYLVQGDEPGKPTWEITTRGKAGLKKRLFQNGPLQDKASGEEKKQLVAADDADKGQAGKDSSIATWLLLILGGCPVEGSFSKKIDLFDVGMGDSCASSIV